MTSQASNERALRSLDDPLLRPEQAAELAVGQAQLGL